MNDNTPRYPDYATQAADQAARLKKMAPHDRRVAVDRIRQGLLAQIPAVSMLATLQAWPPPDGDDPGAARLAQNIRDYHAGHRPGTGNGTGRPAGNGHDSELAALVMRMVMRGCDDEEIETEWWKLAEPPRDPSWPYSHADFLRHLDGARRKAPAFLAESAAKDDALLAALGTSAEEITARMNGSVPAPGTMTAAALAPSLLGGMKDGAYLTGARFDALRYHVDGLVPEGMSALIGAPKIGKSWLVLSWALDVAKSGRAVVYLALEDGDRRMQSRCRTLTGSDDIPAGFRYITHVPPGAIVPAVREAMEAFGADRPLIILDTLGKAMVGYPVLNGESPFMREYRIASELKAAADDCPGSGLLITHHNRKAAADDFIDTVSGTHGLTGAVDAILVLTRPRGEGGGLLQIVGRDVREGEYAMTFAAGRWTLDGGNLTAAAGRAAARKAARGLGDTSAAIVQFVTERGENGTRAPDVAGAFDMTADDAGKYLRRLADTHRIALAGRGLFSPLGVTARPAPKKKAGEVSEASETSISHGRRGQTLEATRSVSDASDTSPGVFRGESGAVRPVSSLLCAGCGTAHYPHCEGHP